MSASDFRMVRPVIATDANLISSSVPEALVAAYAAGTTYAAGDVRGVATGTAQSVYESLQAGNVGNAPAASPAWWKLLGVVYAAYSEGTTYGLGDVVSDISLDVHETYESLAAGNLGNAVSDKTKWLPRGKTNRWKMFDTGVSSQTVAPESITFSMAPGLINTVTLLNVQGASVNIQQPGSAYNKTKSLVSHDVLSWYDFYYQEPVRAGDVVFDDVPPYASSELIVTVTNPGADAAIGCCLVGKARVLGQTQKELGAGAISYSGSTTDKFGNTTLVKRTNAKRVNYNVFIPRGFEDEAFRLLTEATDVGMLFFGSTEYSLAISYGTLGQWEVPISSSGKPAPIEVRGFT